jgi:antitoxin HicB
MRYPVTLTPDDNQAIVVTFPDVPGAITYGATVEEALTRAPDALLTVFDALVKDRRDLPAPSPTRGPSIALPALETAKLALYETLRTARVSKAELGRRLDWHPTQVDRLLALTHASRLDQLDAAFRAVGKRLVVAVEDAAASMPAPPSRALQTIEDHLRALSPARQKAIAARVIALIAIEHRRRTRGAKRAKPRRRVKTRPAASSRRRIAAA